MRLSRSEFWQSTPAEFAALRYRREVEFRHRCFVAGIVAADYRNAHRSGDGDRIVSPLDYVACEEMTAEEIAAEQEEQNRASVQRMLGAGMIREKAN